MMCGHVLRNPVLDERLLDAARHHLAEWRRRWRQLVAHAWRRLGGLGVIGSGRRAHRRTHIRIAAEIVAAHRHLIRRAERIERVRPGRHRRWMPIWLTKWRRHTVAIAAAMHRRRCGAHDLRVAAFAVSGLRLMHRILLLTTVARMQLHLMLRHRQAFVMVMRRTADRLHQMRRGRVVQHRRHIANG